MKFYSRFICEQCPASFIHKNHLNRHIKKAHTGDAAAKPQKKPRQPRSSNKGFTMSYMNFFIFILCNWDFCIEKTSYQKYYLKGVTQKLFDLSSIPSLWRVPEPFTRATTAQISIASSKYDRISNRIWRDPKPFYCHPQLDLKFCPVQDII